jgi:uncharacterized protein YkwD
MLHKSTRLCLVWICVGLTSGGANAKPVPPAKPAVASATQEVQWEQRVIELTNAARAKYGLKPLRRQEQLQAAAQWMGEDMARERYFSHTDSKGRSIGERLPDLGYRNYRMIAENIAGGQKTPDQVVAAWMNSPGHRANILNPRLEEIGVAYVERVGSPLHRYWVQEFGTRF